MLSSAQSYQPVSRDAIDSSLAQNLDFATLDDLDPSLGALLQLVIALAVGHSCIPVDYISQVNLTRAASSAADGFYVYYEREVPFELRSSEGSDLPSEVGCLSAWRAPVVLSRQWTASPGMILSFGGRFWGCIPISINIYVP
jgi:hypothetical protein